MIHLTITLAALLIAAAACASASPFDPVRTAKSFAIGGVGVAGVTSAEEHAYRELRDGRDAQDQFRKLLRDGSPAGQMYAADVLSACYFGHCRCPPDAAVSVARQVTVERPMSRDAEGCRDLVARTRHFHRMECQRR